MTLIKQFVLVVTGCVALSLLAVATIQGVLDKAALVDQAKAEASDVARVIAHGAVNATGRQGALFSAPQGPDGLQTLLNTLVAQTSIRSIRIVDASLHTIHSAGSAPPDSDDDRELARSAIADGKTHADLHPGFLKVATPVSDSASPAAGAILIAISRQRLDKLMHDWLIDGVTALAIALLVGAAAAVALARGVVRPMQMITAAARDVEQGRFEPKSLAEFENQTNDIGVLAAVFTRMAVDMQSRAERLESLVSARTRELREKNAALEEAKRRVEADLSVARALQNAMLPQEFPEHPAYSGKAFMLPALEMCGDFYDFFSISDDHVGLVIGDVSGKGVPAAFFMAISRTVMRGCVGASLPAGDCLSRANRILCTQNPLDLFVTLFYGILDVRTGELKYANAGHNPPLLVRHADGEVTSLTGTGGLPMGLFPDLAYAERDVTLRPGDTLFLYTDGISEATDEAGQEFTQMRLASSLSQNHRHSVEIVIAKLSDALAAFVGAAPQSDDITALVLQYRGGQRGAL